MADLLRWARIHRHVKASEADRKVRGKLEAGCAARISQMGGVRGIAMRWAKETQWSGMEIGEKVMGDGYRSWTVGEMRGQVVRDIAAYVREVRREEGIERNKTLAQRNTERMLKGVGEVL